MKSYIAILHMNAGESSPGCGIVRMQFYGPFATYDLAFRWAIVAKEACSLVIDYEIMPVLPVVQ